MDYNQILKKVKNTQLAYYVLAAEKLSISWKLLIPGALVQFSKGKKKWRQLKAISPINDSVAMILTTYKDTCSSYLRKHGYSVPRHKIVNNVKDILDFKKENKIKDIVIKPVKGFGGMGITILPRNDKQIKEGLQLAEDKSLSRRKTKILVEEYVKGNNYRILVLGKKVIAAVYREPAKVIGDGTSNIGLLIDVINLELKDQNKGSIQMDLETTEVLSSQGLTLKSILKKGQSVQLRLNCNLCSGGTSSECLSKVNKYFKKIAIDVTNLVGLRLSGIDIITPDITNPNAGYSINELNHNPGLRTHYLPDKGKPVDVALKIQKYILDNI